MKSRKKIKDHVQSKDHRIVVTWRNLRVKVEFTRSTLKKLPLSTSSVKWRSMATVTGRPWVFQRRMNGKINFFRKWESYKTGFGNLNGEHWLGNEHLHKLTSHGKYSLRIDMSDFKNNHRHAVYNKFFVGSESAGYKLDVTGYSGDAGDSMAVHQNGKKFTTIDKDQDAHGENCAKYYKGGWWYGACHQCNLNGLYLKGSSTIVVEKSEKLRLYSGVGKSLFSSSEESDADVPDVNNNDVEFVPDICCYRRNFYFFTTDSDNEVQSNLKRRKLESSKETVNDYLNYCREICCYVVENIKPQKIGGPGLIVEIDEAKFGKRGELWTEIGF
ncbi:Angiopoietin-related protein 1,Ficolin-1-A,Angiopoietin-1,Fibrinogen C domain-containing protein 1,Ryncolin-1,Tenascin-N,Angiopoietin-related protein 7,Angiopoietin-related protein 6,Ficolin-3,Fibrinogen C domain-containing protein 1-B,Fibroleukin,Fibrinogen-like protein 1,Ficolin-1,Ficolin-1-B,Angiopoietin-4,Tenascin-R,Ryncolin-2,Techylectin-5B,Fibrinogen C domain-containing protein 1-A,Protein scabrous,Microfibril-associated glycoprotein 4,Fibrinogen-like protein A,Ryncolin-3,Tenascin-X,Ficolin-2,Fibrino|uniref:Fibrinogen C-terminal domain-containing protein n=1 Tax=Mytilus edulis TaxID=6550 RepID=A0A8S3TK09_MYTED|nr:Angiopoietin-related protein 1,Ficolin-1-A,Angiopoietin-1,Fibrinogen C domain-containing protein 1,Ryncolin-1,Tenascin-N,Angiopoietin-related protein 7,Angiopoietin-related protein 6,Ficolin-3,Fibrinogen C domain-containing protein 1-B,Fibroleukin,Fibrinogen-like protein 1,Ficolin-1,Ficolin-1-B,Angiopoietin-4,Tenascin-R,Ryncolin-2,Techylectin-5B,Fibrinogen C domain-containing protein 1-A,Protein scabrous,Microfibril-associated glycoprotein 4,Fibrinogen-like protein A,Ryncolin-3,Tenascin-X,Ficoli